MASHVCIDTTDSCTEDIIQSVVECTAMCCSDNEDEPYHQISNLTGSKKRQGSQADISKILADNSSMAVLLYMQCSLLLLS